jgi:predicted ATPase
MERAAGFVLNDTPQVKVDKLDAMLTQTSTSKQDAALFAEMLSLPNKFSIPPQVGPQRGQTAHHMLMLGRALSVTRRYPVLNMDPQQRRQKTLEALTAQVEALSRQNPVLMIFEDVHWTDPTSLEMFGRAVDPHSPDDALSFGTDGAIQI